MLNLPIKYNKCAVAKIIFFLLLSYSAQPSLVVMVIVCYSRYIILLYCLYYFIALNAKIKSLMLGVL